ncbi:hypothetical protein MJN85_29050, partial [Salmonella enterica subsp. enterica serovar Anatum]|nr:hypothetical protein [Salmonella enterica subsp. enterica serovar Anatum]
IDARQLWRQIRLWHPWVIMLKAGWFEYRWRQTGEQQFIRLADAPSPLTVCNSASSTAPTVP